ncbi:hypothetical protein [Catellatospora paridis]|uniref:hypothetical protein n=1 Tax=Catellatospora paridis TaxID=1617086 RepID=UPI0012D3AF36|nr:hypothetical protein [Catellatospora paridis]
MVRVTNRTMTGSCFAGVKVTLDVEPAAERSIHVADDFIDLRDRDRDDEYMREELANEQWVAELTTGALRGVRSALMRYEYRTGPLRVVLVKHYLHIVDSGYGAVQAAASRAVRAAIDQLPHRMVCDWVTFTPAGPVVRLANPVDPEVGVTDAEVFVEVTPAAERAVVLAEDFAAGVNAPRLDAADLARIPDLAVAAAHAALDKHEERVGPLRLTLLGHRPHQAVPWSLEHQYRDALDDGVRMAVEQLEFALAEQAG